ncbi:MAG: hypothetical protein LBF23_01120 [Endomicrobium sp.]|nr:hypothetical protein [Endomicrobium sp.]
MNIERVLDFLPTIISFSFGILGGIWLSDRQERKRVKKEQDNTLSYIAIYLTHIYIHIREVFNFIFSSQRENYSFELFELNEYFDKTDFKVFDERYDISCLVRFHCLLHDFNHYVKSLKFGNDVKEVGSSFNFIFAKECSKHKMYPNDPFIKGIICKNEIVMFFEKFKNASGELKEFFNSNNTNSSKAFSILLGELKKFEDFYKDNMGDS